MSSALGPKYESEKMVVFKKALYQLVLPGIFTDIDVIFFWYPWRFSLWLKFPKGKRFLIRLSEDKQFARGFFLWTYSSSAGFKWKLKLGKKLRNVIESLLKEAEQEYIKILLEEKKIEEVNRQWQNLLSLKEDEGTCKGSIGHDRLNVKTRKPSAWRQLAAEVFQPPVRGPYQPHAVILPQLKEVVP